MKTIWRTKQSGSEFKVMRLNDEPDQFSSHVLDNPQGIVDFLQPACSVTA